jgi:cytochrome c oxidase cbb3-type subunit III
LLIEFTAESLRLYLRLSAGPRLCHVFLGAGLLAAILLRPPLVWGVENPPVEQAASPKRSAAPAADTGKKLFDGNCAGCHGLDARGGEHAPDLATRPQFQRMSDQQLFGIVHDGAASLAMPAFRSTLSDARISAVVRYLRSLQGRTGGALRALPGDPAAGQSLFFGKAGCSECHSIVDRGSGSGGFLASDLTSYAAGREPADILHAITSPDQNPNPRARTAVVVTVDGQKLTGLIRNQDNFSLQLQSLDGTFYLLQRSELASVTYEPHSLMPADYSQRLAAAELNDLASFLMRTAAAAPPAARRDKKGHNNDDDH